MMLFAFALSIAVCIELFGPIVMELSRLVVFSSAETIGIAITKSRNIGRMDSFLIFSPPIIIL